MLCFVISTILNTKEEYQLILTKDGSHTVIKTSDKFGYHSHHGAIQESKHIFIENGLKYFLSQNPNANKLSILEIGFGTGLNSLLTKLETKNLKIPISYTALEIQPLPSSFLNNINYPDLLNLSSEETNDFLSWHNSTIEKSKTFKRDNFELTQINQDFITFQQKSTFDIIYYDAFGPTESPNLWSQEILFKTASLLNENGIWISFCAKGQVKRDLKSSGLKVQALPGPPGKREITRAIKIK